MESFIHNHVDWFLFFIILIATTLSSGRTLDPHQAEVEPLVDDHPLTFFMRDVFLTPTPPSATKDGLSSPRVNTVSVSSANWWPFLASMQAMDLGIMTIVDDKITGSTDLEGRVTVGKVKWIYVTSMADNSSCVVAIRATFPESEDSLRFFGVHQPKVAESVIVVVGGTGKYKSANGYAVAKTVDPGKKTHSREIQLSVYLK